MSQPELVSAQLPLLLGRCPRRYGRVVIGHDSSFAVLPVAATLGCVIRETLRFGRIAASSSPQHRQIVFTSEVRNILISLQLSLINCRVIS